MDALVKVLRRLGGQRGSVAVLFAFLLTSLVGMASLSVDVGSLFVARRQLQNAADAAAHAGAQLLPDSAAAAVAAQQYWDLNVPAGATMTVTFPPGTDALIHIDASLEANTYFARIVGESSITVRAQAEVAQPPRDVMVVIDRSSSMCIDSTPIGACPLAGPWSPFSAVQLAALDFSSFFTPTYDAIGLVSFGTAATLDRQLSSAFGAGSPFETGVNAMHPNGLTNIGQGLSRASGELGSVRASSDAVKAIVLLTDGVPDLYWNGIGWSYAGTPAGVTAAKNYTLQQAQAAADAGYTLYVIGLGAGADQAFLESLATTGNGFFQEAPTAGDLQTAFENIARLARVHFTQ